MVFGSELEEYQPIYWHWALTSDDHRQVESRVSNQKSIFRNAADIWRSYFFKLNWHHTVIPNQTQLSQWKCQSIGLKKTMIHICFEIGLVSMSIWILLHSPLLICECRLSAVNYVQWIKNNILLKENCLCSCTKCLRFSRTKITLSHEIRLTNFEKCINNST